MIRIFVGTPANNEDLECQAVLAHSLMKHASEPLEITWLMLSSKRRSFWYSSPAKHVGWNTKGWATPFTGLRWGIPEFCNWKGRAIYLDSDQIAMADIAGLWNQDFGDGAILARAERQTSVMLMDCAALKDLLPSVVKLKVDCVSHKACRLAVGKHMRQFDGEWNSLDGQGYESARDPAIKILHYTRIPSQPNHVHARARLESEGKLHWFSGPDEKHPLPDLQEVFDELLAESIAAGRGPDKYRVKHPFGWYGRGKADSHLVNS